MEFTCLLLPSRSSGISLRPFSQLSCNLKYDILLISACASSHWGADCANECQCSTSVATCDPAEGCVECLPGWTGGYNCPDNINECNETLGICGDNSECTDSLGSYECTCHDGFTRDSGDCEGMKCCILKYMNQ